MATTWSIKNGPVTGVSINAATGLLSANQIGWVTEPITVTVQVDVDGVKAEKAVQITPMIPAQGDLNFAYSGAISTEAPVDLAVTTTADFFSGDINVGAAVITAAGCTFATELKNGKQVVTLTDTTLTETATVETTIKYTLAGVEHTSKVNLEVTVAASNVQVFGPDEIGDGMDAQYATNPEDADGGGTGSV